LGSTHTWMGTSIKIGLALRLNRSGGNPRTSGTVFSNVGPLTELYDHSDYEQQHYALKGFLKDAYHSLSKAERQELVLQQLAKYYGAVAADVLAYEELVWRQETFTFADYTSDLLPHQHNGHPVYRRPYLNGRLYVAGSETAAHFPGYMDGAVASADWVYHQLLAAD
jgi:monoamine oxidase